MRNPTQVDSPTTSESARCSPHSSNRKCETSSGAKTEDLRVNLTIDGTPIASRSHTHPSHYQTSRLLTSSLSLGAPVPRTTQCM